MFTEPVKSNGSDQDANISLTSEQPQKPADKFQDSSDPVSVALEKRYEELLEAEAVCGAVSNARTSALAFGIPMFSISLAVIAGKAPAFFQWINLADAFSFRVKVLLLWLLAGLVAVPLYYFIFWKRLAQALERLNRAEEAYIAKRLSTIDGRKEYFREQLFKFSSKASRVFFGDEKRFSEASQFAAKAGNGLDEAQSTAALSLVQGYLNSLGELVSREEREQKEERYWQYAAIAIMIVYVAGLIFAARIDFVSPTPQYHFGVPQSVILWGAAGSLAAILYRFYTEQGQIRFATEFRWLIARPIIGIIMGGVVYIALNSGLILLTTPNTTQSAAGAAASPAIHINSFWIVAFLAGFSDKFYLGVIDLLVARTVKTEEVNKNTVVTQIERIPESAKLETSNTTEEPGAKQEFLVPATAGLTR